MNITLTTTRSAFDEAIRVAREIGAGGTIRGMAAPLDGAMLGGVDEVWESIEAGLHEAYLYGKERVSATVQAISVRLGELLSRAGKRAAEVQGILLEKLQGFLKTFVNTTLALIPGEITAGGRKLSMRNVKLSHKLSLSGKLEFSVTKVFELVSEGELQLDVEYALAP